MERDKLFEIVNAVLGKIILLIVTTVSLLGSYQNIYARNRHYRYGKATVYLDHYGVPHIYGPTDASVIYASAWVEANADWPLVEENFIRATGRAAEYYGVKTLGDDYLDRALQIPKLSREEYERDSPKMQKLMDAYAAGFNDWLAAHPKKQHWLKHVEPWYTLALLRFKYDQLEFLGYAGFRKSMEDRLLSRGWPVGTKNTPAISMVMKPNDYELGSIIRYAGSNEGPMGGHPLGSNEWAIAPSRTADHHAMLLVNPHQSFFGIQQYYEIHLHSDEGLVFSGNTRFGYLFPYMGNNAHLGWTYTDNYPDIGDLYIEKFVNQKDPMAYRYGKKYREATTWTESVKVKIDNKIQIEKLRFWKTLHGPVIGLDKKGRPLAVRLAKLHSGGWYDQLYAMMTSHNFKEFHSAEAMLNIPYMNLMYADEKGNIWYVYNGAVPRRDTTFDWSKPVDGSNPKTAWHGYHTLSELPQVFDPKSGYLENCNSSPMFVTDSVPYKRSDFPPYMIGPEINDWRSRSSRQALRNMHDVTFDEFARDVWNTHMAKADDDIPEILKEWDKLRTADISSVPDSIRPGTKMYKELKYVIGRLTKWNRISRIESVPATWFIESLEYRHEMLVHGENSKWSYLVAMTHILTALQDRWGTIEVPWGEVNRLQRPPEDDPSFLSDSLPSLPVGGAPTAVFAFYPVLQPKPNQWWMGPGRVYGTAGSTFVKVIDFGSKIKSRSVIDFGQSADPKSPHFFDQAPLYAQRMFKPAWFSKKAVKEHAVTSYKIGN